MNSSEFQGRTPNSGGSEFGVRPWNSMRCLPARRQFTKHIYSRRVLNAETKAIAALPGTDDIAGLIERERCVTGAEDVPLSLLNQKLLDVRKVKGRNHRVDGL